MARDRLAPEFGRVEADVMVAVHTNGRVQMDVDAEQATCAACFVDPEAFKKISSIIQQPADFHDERFRWIYEAMLALDQRGGAINQITVAHELQLRDRLESTGGPAFLSVIVAQLPTPIGVEHYAYIVRRCAYYRNLQATTHQIGNMASEGGPDAAAVQTRAIALIEALDPGTAENRYIPEPATSWVEHTPTANVYLEDLNIMRASVVVTAGDAAVSKTMAADEFALASANARPAFGRFPAHVGTSLIIDSDNPEGLHARRLQLQAAACGDSLDGIDILFRPDLNLADAGHVHDLVDLVSRNQYTLVVLDVLRRFYDGDENASATYAPVQRGLRALADAGPVVDVLHHLRKPQANQSNELLHRAAGTRDIMGGADTGIVLSKLGEGRVLVQNSKPRWGAPFAPWSFRVHSEGPDEPIFVEYEGHADEAPDKRETCIVRAEELIAAEGPRPRKDLLDALRREGFRTRTIEDALGFGVSRQRLSRQHRGKIAIYSLVTQGLEL